LLEAIDAFEADPLVDEVLITRREEFHGLARGYLWSQLKLERIDLKRDEWAKFHHEVSNYERQ
jgi:hypothetical protein